MEQTTFLALYRGQEIGASKLLALTADPDIVRDFAERMLADSETEDDPVAGELDRGRRRALELVRDDG